MAERSPVVVARSEWLSAMQDLALACAEGADEETAPLVREMNDLLLVTPDAGWLTGLQPIGPARLTVLLEAGAPDSAVITMLARGSGYLLSRNGDGHSLASVALPGSGRENSAAGANPALALMGALALSLTSAAATSRFASARTSLGAEAVLH